MTDQPDRLAPDPSQPPGRVVDTERLRVLAAHAGVALSPDREQALGKAVTELVSDLDHLRTLRLGETPPATAFDARWT